MNLEDARRILREPPRFGDKSQIEANQFMVLRDDLVEQLNNFTPALVAAAIREWSRSLDLGDLVEVENIIWREQRSRRHR